MNETLENIGDAILFVFVYAAIVVVAVAILFALYIIMTDIHERIQSKNELDESKTHVNQFILAKSDITYSKEIMEFVKQLTIDICILRYDSFKDSIVLKKSNKKTFENMIKETLQFIMSALVSQNDSGQTCSIDFDRLIYSREFLEQYIMNTCIYTIKNMMEETINADDNSADIEFQ